MNEQQRSLMVFKDLRDRRKHLRELRGRKEAEAAPPPAPQDPNPGEKTIEGFHAFAWPLVLQSHSQVFQDLWVLYELGMPKTGYFVEFGAANGMTMSNSFMMERRLGWQGIISEPNPGFHDSIARARKCHFSPKAVYSETGQVIEFSCAERPMFSRLEAPGTEETATHAIEVQSTVRVETISLNDLLDAFDAPAVIDYLSVDTEGTELDILRAFDFSRRRVRALTVEHNFTSMREALYDILTAQGYRRRFAGLSRFDDWYLHESVISGQG